MQACSRVTFLPHTTSADRLSAGAPDADSTRRPAFCRVLPDTSSRSNALVMRFRSQQRKARAALPPCLLVLVLLLPWRPAVAVQGEWQVAMLSRRRRFGVLGGWAAADTAKLAAPPPPPPLPLPLPARLYLRCAHLTALAADNCYAGGSGGW